ncbi:MAG: hypothetical protein OEV94_05570 [Deltaproteobacteria bacterium]|nr:hypothetical protein [Deltaproteobacteria bacterium]
MMPIRWRFNPARVLLIIGLALSLLGPVSLARAEDLMLESDNDPGFISGTLFFAMSAGFLIQAEQEYTQSKAALKLADQNYQLYLAATLPADALFFRSETERYHSLARWKEARANVGAWVGVSLFMAGWYAWLPEDWLPSGSIITANGNGLLYAQRF